MTNQKGDGRHKGEMQLLCDFSMCFSWLYSQNGPKFALTLQRRSGTNRHQYTGAVTASTLADPAEEKRPGSRMLPSPHVTTGNGGFTVIFRVQIFKTQGFQCGQKRLINMSNFFFFLN